MRNCIEYVLQEHKTEQTLVYVTGPAPEEVTYDSVYKCFLDEKKIWGKDSGRMYAHNIISWHKDEQISLQDALKFGKAFAEKWFEGFQTLIGVHKDRNHVHVHLVTIITEPEVIPGTEKGMGRKDTDAELRDGTASGEKQSIRERLEVYRETVKQKEQEQHLANQTHKRTRGRGR